MAKLPLKNSENKELQTLDVSDRVFAEHKRPHIVAEMVRYQMARRHRGTHRAKSRSFVSMSSRKPFAQKGTGQARRGDFRSPLLYKGGVPFPPIPRSYAFQLPRKARKAAVRSVLSDKLRDQKICVLDDHGIKAVKTKDALKLFANLGFEKAILVIPKKDDVLEKSVRNLTKFKVLRVDGLNVYDLLYFDQVILLKGALPLLEQRLS